MSHVLIPALGAVAVLTLPAGLAAQQNPKELGKVTWLRDYDKAVTRSKKTRKPVFLLFQEVPG
ncbi:MAG: hypothetical protein ACYTGW_14850 [Planctomycetota bacterium]|jgi:hypothetical protein